VDTLARSSYLKNPKTIHMRETTHHIIIAHHFVTYALHSIVLLEPKWANSGTYMWSEYFNIRGFESFRTFFGPMKEADCKKNSELVMNPQLININHNNYP
jgi:hypothetical protein